MNTQKLPIVIAGPTASGKTDIALALAHLCDGDIISADSRQVYKPLPSAPPPPKASGTTASLRPKAYVTAL